MAGTHSWLEHHRIRASLGCFHLQVPDRFDALSMLCTFGIDAAAVALAI